MKHIKQIFLCVIAASTLSLNLIAQAPQKFNYQALARNNNSIIANGTVGVQLSILDGATGPVLYKETQTAPTNAWGIFSLQVGAGTVVTGSMTSIAWKDGNKYLKVEMDPTGGTSYTDMGTTELVSVPYALHSEGAWIMNGGDISNPNTGAVNIQNGNLSLNDNEIRLRNSGDGNHVLKYDSGIDGPYLFGVGGGALGSIGGGHSFHWNGSGDAIADNYLYVNKGLIVDDSQSNTGTSDYSLHFGGGGSGEAIGSNRSGAANNQYGLDFYTGSGGKRMAITNDGKVGIGTDQPVALFTVKGSGGSYGNHIALFENTDGANADGIAIKIDNGTTDKDNNFVTFMNANGDVKGRIEGFNGSTDWITPPSITIPSTTLTYNFNQGTLPAFTQTNAGTLPTFTQTNAGTLPTASFNQGSFPSLACCYSLSSGTLPTLSFNSGSFPSYSFNSGVFPTYSFNPGTLPSLTFPNNPLTFNLPSQSDANNLACWGIENDVVDMLNLDPFSLAANNLREVAILACKDGGVTYGSHGADYAEYIEKTNPAEFIQALDVVGIKGGKVTRNTEDAEQIMIVSNKPVVLGNTPKEGEEKNFVTCGFMGQLPCVVRGLCHKGDYVLASNLNDGTAIAVAPENLKLEMLNKIVGRAWEEQTSDIYGLVNVAIGLKTNEWVEIFKQQENKMAAMQNQCNSLSADVQQMKAMMGLDKPASASVSINK